jgi:hypothetical protein
MKTDRQLIAEAMASAARSRGARDYRAKGDEARCPFPLGSAFAERWREGRDGARQEQALRDAMEGDEA